MFAQADDLPVTVTLPALQAGGNGGYDSTSQFPMVITMSVPTPICIGVKINITASFKTSTIC
ncbi:MAG: hypothetical protein PHW62_01145 [Candidatus Ratteibacteria bacterium]|nr:hypothetical protein [Candidatus Ratteibacteria bacterium]